MLAKACMNSYVSHKPNQPHVIKGIHRVLRTFTPNLKYFMAEANRFVKNKKKNDYRFEFSELVISLEMVLLSQFHFFLCPRENRLTVFLHLEVAYRWWSHAVYPSWCFINLCKNSSG